MPQMKMHLSRLALLLLSLAIVPSTPFTDRLTGGEALYHYGGRTAQFCLGYLVPPRAFSLIGSFRVEGQDLRPVR